MKMEKDLYLNIEELYMQLVDQPEKAHTQFFNLIIKCKFYIFSTKICFGATIKTQYFEKSKKPDKKQL